MKEQAVERVILGAGYGLSLARVRSNDFFQGISGWMTELVFYILTQ
jgi:hypothetical protein